MPVVAVLVPVVNVTIVTAMPLMLQRGGKSGVPMRRIFRGLLRNPPIAPLALAVGADPAGLGGMPVQHPARAIPAGPAPPIMLLAVGSTCASRRCARVSLRWLRQRW